MSTIVTRAGKGSPLTHTEVDNNFTNLNTDKAEDSTVVKLSGDQTIAGTKTFSSTITGSVSGNAGTATNGVVTTGSYANPSWITSLDDGKVLPSMTGNSGKYLTTNGTDSSWGTIVTSSFPAGTVMLFRQTAAPTGWTKDTTNYNNHALRVVTGTAASGGSVGFTTAFASQGVGGSISSTTATNQAATQGGSISVGVSAGTLAVGSTTLSTSQIPSHSHINGSKRIHDAADGLYGVGTSGTDSNVLARQVGSGQPFESDNTQSIGGGGSHNHSISGSPSVTSATFTGSSHNHTQDAHSHTFTGTAINLAVQYVDVIFATKD